MSSVANYSLLLVMCFSSCLLDPDPHLNVAVVEGHLGENASIQCSTEDKNQDGVYLWRKKPEETKPQIIFYFYYDGTFNPHKDANVTVHKSGTFPSLTITFLNLNVTDSAHYWCEFNYEEYITFSIVTWLSVKAPVKECPDNTFLFYVAIACAVFSVITLLCIIVVIVKVKRRCNYKPESSGL